MQRVSTNFTLFFKLFLPTFWAVFFGMFTLFAIFYNQSEILLLQGGMFKISVAIIYLLFFAFFYFTLFQLKRVEMGGEYYTVSNYFSTYRLIYDDIDYITETRLLAWILVKIRLKGKGSFGKNIVFLAHKNLYSSFLNEHALVASLWRDRIKK